MRAVHPFSLFSVAAIGVAAYGRVSRATHQRRTVRRDQKFRRALQKARWLPGDVVAHATNPLGKAWLHIPAAVMLSRYVAQRGRGRGALVPVLASVAAEVLSRTLDRTPPHRKPPPGHPKQHKPSFPSGHALETTAVSATSAYVLARERLAAPRDAFAAAAALSLASTFGRLYLDRHWASDAVAGTVLGISIAATCGALYEMAEANADHPEPAA